MSDEAKREFEVARNEQLSKNDARHIRARVKEARGSRVRAGRRWPFELLQNAHDPGPKAGADAVNVSFVREGADLIVAHDGKPFNITELAALTSGGSSKEFESEETTGRFGTGFLVTHAISTRVDLNAVMVTTAGGLERFNAELDRGGDEDAILANIMATAASVQAAVPVDGVGGAETADFRYHEADPEVVRLGLERLHAALPYLYATCPHLGEVSLDLRDQGGAGAPAIWSAGDIVARTEPGLHIALRPFRVEIGGEARGGRTLRVAEKADSRSALLLVLDDAEDGAALRDIAEGFPRVFIQFPIAGSDFLPINVVVEGRFEPHQERDAITMSEEDKGLLEGALRLLPDLVVLATREGWRGAHRLALLAAPSETFEGEQGTGEEEWWETTISGVASTVAEKAVVMTTGGLLPTVGAAGERACFVVPRCEEGSASEVDGERLHDLARRVDGLHPVVPELATEWADVADRWAELGVPVTRVGLAELAAYVKAKAKRLEEVRVDGDAAQWIVDFLGLAVEAPQGYDVRPLLHGLLPDQRGALRPPSELRLGEGVTATVKDVGDEVGIDLRSMLLHEDVDRLLREPGNEAAADLIAELIPNTMTDGEAVDLVLSELKKLLPDGEAGTDAARILRASASLIDHLGGHGHPHVDRIEQCPVLTLSGEVTRLILSTKILAPVEAWDEDARPFAGLYTDKRILSPLYATDAKMSAALAPLIAAGLAITQPLNRGVRRDVEDAALVRELVVEGDKDIALRGEEYSQIAFLSGEVMNRCRSDLGSAKRLLEFVLTYVAARDQAWEQVRNTNGFRERTPVPVRIRDTLWLAEMKAKAWIPVETEEGTTNVPATAGSLAPLIDPKWLSGNDAGIRLLHREFGFSELELLIKSIADEEERKEVEGDLAAFLREGQDVVKTVAEELRLRKERERVKERNRRFGLDVQDAIREALELRGLELKFVDMGFDYEVLPESALASGAPQPDALSLSANAGPYLLEVKATTTGEVRLTPKQAQTASERPEAFVLCVVDLRGTPSGRLDQSWTAADVEPLTRFVAGIGGNVEEVWSPVDALARADDGVRLRNEFALRYGVAPTLWEQGLTIDDWVGAIVTPPGATTPTSGTPP